MLGLLDLLVVVMTMTMTMRDSNYPDSAALVGHLRFIEMGMGELLLKLLRRVERST